MIKFRSHQTANSPEFKSGCPGQWPQIEERVDDSRRLTAEEVAEGFTLITVEEHTVIRTQYKAAFDLWESSRRVVDETDVQSKRTEMKNAFDALEAVRTRPGDFTLRQLSDFAKLEARLWQLIIRNASDLFDR